MKLPCTSSLYFALLAAALVTAPPAASGQTAPAPQQPAAKAPAPKVQTAPADQNHPTRNFDTPVGIFTGQSDIGGTTLPGGSLFDPRTKQYTVSSAGYNTVYTRDEFRYLWDKVSGDVSIAADISFPDRDGYEGRKAVLVIRQSLDGDAKEAVVAVYGNGMFRLGQRPHKGQRRLDMDYRVWSREGSGNPPARISSVIMPRRVGLVKSGDAVVLYVSIQGEPMHPIGAPLILHMSAPFYVGIGFCSNLRDKSDQAIFSDVDLENSAAPLH